jgi:hypothetical protein
LPVGSPHNDSETCLLSLSVSVLSESGLCRMLGSCSCGIAPDRYAATLRKRKRQATATRECATLSATDGSWTHTAIGMQQQRALTLLRTGKRPQELKERDTNCYRPVVAFCMSCEHVTQTLDMTNTDIWQFDLPPGCARSWLTCWIIATAYLCVCRALGLPNTDTKKKFVTKKKNTDTCYSSDD